MERKPLTEKQQEIYDFLKDQILYNGYPPSVRDIGDAVHLKSTSSVHSHLETLEKKGYIRRDPFKPRTIEIVDDSFQFARRELVSVPILGRVAAGEPLLADDNIQGYFPVPMDYITNNRQNFMLTVKGESMIEAGIFDGDMILVEQTNVCSNGEIVVALIEDSATVKRFFKEADHIRLQPENSAFEPIIVKDCMILGRVHGLYRNFH